MDNQQILNTTITIEEVIDKGKKLSIKGNDGRTFTYTVWKSKQDGSDSLTYAQFKTMGLGVGSTVYVGYVIDEFNTEIGGQVKKVQSKKIINFREPVGQVPSQAKTSNSGANRASQGSSGDAFGRRLAIHGMVNGMLAAGIKPTDITPEVLSQLDMLENRIDQGLLASANATPNRVANLTEDLPIINVDEDDLPPF